MFKKITDVKFATMLFLPGLFMWALPMKVRAQNISNTLPTTEQRIEDSVLGWWGPNKYDHYLPAARDQGPLEKRKIANMDKFVEWVHASYTPVGGLGTSVRRVFGPTKYGVIFGTWNVSAKKEWLGPDGLFKPIPEEHTDFHIDVNTLPGSYGISFINKDGGPSYFIWQPDGWYYDADVKKRRAKDDPRIHPHVYKWITRINEWQTIILAPGNKLPLTPVTQRELLDQAEAALPNELVKARKEAEQHWPGNSKSIDESVAYAQKNVVDRYRTRIQQLRQKHAATLDQQAYVTCMQCNIRSFEVDPDIFDAKPSERGINNFYPVYKLEQSVIERCKSDKPLWISVSFPYETSERGNQLWEMYRSVSENINYDYIYNYFWDTVKVRGVAYAPDNGAEWKSRLDAYRNKYKRDGATLVNKQAALPAGAVLYDDFSKDAPGSRPAGWYVPTYAKTTNVARVEGVSYLKMGYNTKVSSTALPALPRDFQLEYDVLTDGFADRTGAAIHLIVSASKKKRADGVMTSAAFEVWITSGKAEALRANHDYRGELRVRLWTEPSTMDYNNKGGIFEVAQPEFTDEKRKVHVAVRKKGGNLSISLNGKELGNSEKFVTLYGKPCGDCVIPADLTFDTWAMESLTQDADQVGTYITNVKVTKL